jgi:acetyl-CoA synthase
MKDPDEIDDGKIELVGPDFDEYEEGAAMDLGIVIEVSGRKMQKDFEPVLERQIHYFLNAASGVQHIGQRDIAWIRISKAAADKGFTLKHFGDIVYARFKGDPWNSIVDKAQVKLITDPEKMKKWLEKARDAYSERNVRVAGLTDDRVEEFYSCTLCQSFAPTHVCVISPQRLGLCGAYNWLDCKAAHQINPTGPNQPIPKGDTLDPQLGRWSGPEEFVYSHSNQSVERVTMYSIMTDPMTACGCFECMVLVIPEANGVMIVSREDPSMTPAGMTFSTMAGMFGGGLQTPGAMGVGKYYLTSPKFISAEGGFKRVVWMSSFLKESMPEEFKAVADREGVPDLIEQIADERDVETVEELLPWLEEHDHPALKMDPLM